MRIPLRYGCKYHVSTFFEKMKRTMVVVQILWKSQHRLCVCLDETENAAFSKQMTRNGGKHVS